MTAVNVFVSPVILTWGGHVSRFRATWLVFTDTSYVTHSKDKDGWEIGGIFALIFSTSLYYNLWQHRCSHKTEDVVYVDHDLSFLSYLRSAVSRTVPYLNINGTD